MSRVTRSKRNTWIAGILVLVASGALLAFLSMGQQEPDVERVEIREYQGEKLGSVDNFRENSIRGVQSIDPETYTLVVDGLVAAPAAYSYAELQTMSHTAKLVTIHCVEGWSVKALWEGIALPELLAMAQPSDDANTIIFHASDGYTTSLPLDFVLERNLIIADHINGITLPPANGFPYQLVAEDKWGYKWIRWVTRIELSNDPEYEGFWESRGYNNDGDADGPVFGN
ncbi:molybdopterin-dependent oxidoreductase [Candidatus Bipolaricaulota bacterium]|nr:molybdopterin-dependent oxidoreductase [Candidatus Bipolaricaulota bacterium]TFH08483.1 MAG: oxidoreductase [Candidatus Atribacteria bacterium]